ncbi:MAG TPA: sugar transferase [Acidobacteriaceae bacterium]|nr:sugar transferase [Acidobacteriaceae bacterium]
MSSLSFDTLFPSKTGNTTDQRLDDTTAVAQAAHVGKLPARWSDPLPVSVLESRMPSEASPWVLSHTRRVLEFGISLLALVILLPVMLLAAVLVRLGSDGPIFFRQLRMGRNGHEFTLYKFRSMRVEGSECGSCITVVGDTRITPVGAFLRRYKLDEIPQFWNVLRGDMGLVGPRPKLPHHEALHMEGRPGITGVATLAFRREEELLSKIPEHQLDSYYEERIKPAKARMDLQYIRTATFSSDIRILWRTVTSCLFGLQEPLERLEEIIAVAADHSVAAEPQFVRHAGAVPLYRQAGVQTTYFGPEI